MADITKHPVQSAAPLPCLLLAAALCGLGPILASATAAATEGGKILYWAYFPDQTGKSNPGPNSDGCNGIAILRVFDDPQKPAADGYYVLPLYANHQPACAQMLRENSQQKDPEAAARERKLVDPTSCVMPLNCGSPVKTECHRLDAQHMLRSNLERDALTKSKLDLYAEFYQRRGLPGDQGRWIDIRKSVTELIGDQAVSYDERRKRLQPIQSFLTGDAFGEVSDESLVRADAGLDAIILNSLQAPSLCSLLASEVGGDLKNQVIALNNKRLDPVFELGWVSGAVSRQAVPVDDSDSQQQRNSHGLRSFYRLHVRESNGKWKGPFTALGLEPPCLASLRPIAKISDPGQAAKTRDCLNDLANLVYNEDPLQTIIGPLRTLASRIDHWRMPGEEEASEGYLGPLLAPSCADRAAAFARGENTSCDCWGWLDVPPPTKKLSHSSTSEPNWPVQIVYDQDHLKYQIYKTWFRLKDDGSSELSQADWWQTFRDELERKKRPDEQFRTQERSCYYHIPEDNVCISPWYYLNPIIALLILYLLYQWRRRGG